MTALKSIRDWIWDNIELFIIGSVAFVLIGGMILAAVGGRPTLTTGTVADKRYDPAHYTTWTRWQEFEDVRIPFQERTFHADEWSILIEGVKEDGTRHAEWWNVGSALYEEIAIGDQVKRDQETGIVTRTWSKK